MAKAAQRPSGAVVTQRTREIGIRLALGGSRSSAVWLVLRGALAKPTDPLAVGAATLILTLAALGGALIPA